jgi:hypothetical protein
MISLEDEHYKGHIKVYRNNAVQLHNYFLYTLLSY